MVTITKPLNCDREKQRTVSKGAPSIAMSYLATPSVTKQLEYGRLANVVRPEKSLPVTISMPSFCVKNDCAGVLASASTMWSSKTESAAAKITICHLMSNRTAPTVAIGREKHRNKSATV